MGSETKAVRITPSCIVCIGEVHKSSKNSFLEMAFEVSLDLNKKTWQTKRRESLGPAEEVQKSKQFSISSLVNKGIGKPRLEREAGSMLGRLLWFSL